MGFNAGSKIAFDQYNKFKAGAEEASFGAWNRKPVYRFQKGISRWTEYNDPTYLGFVFLFDFGNTIDKNGFYSSPLLSLDEAGSAFGYLKRNNEILRASYLEQFIILLRTINQEMPWYWQSFEGGEGLWKYNSFNEPFKGGDDSVINIECLESIDLKMTLLMDLYRKAVYDQEYKRVLIPENLRKFEMTIIVQEVRKFQIDKFIDMQNRIAAVNIPNVTNPVPGNKDTLLINRNENSPYIEFRLRFCEFDPDVASAPLAALNMMHGDSGGFAKQKLSIKYQLVEEPGNFYPSVPSTVSSITPNIPANNGFTPNKFDDAADGDQRAPLEKLKDSTLKKLEDNAKAEVLDTVGGAFNRLLLGNVYGLGNDLRDAVTRGTIQSLGPELIRNIAERTRREEPRNDLGNAYE